MRCETCKTEIPDDAPVCPHCNGEVGSASETNSADLDAFEFIAFISYRHLPRDQKVAKRVQQAIETYRLPRSIASSWGNARLGKCFRDEDDLAAAHSLPERILEALSKSSALVVVCTPRTKDSVWVQREVAAFIEMHGRERVFTVLADGSSSESIPAYLSSDADPLGGGESVRSNPLAVDMRPQASDKKRDEMLRLVAAIAGCGFDDLKQRERARRRKRIAVAALAAALVVAAIAVASTLAFSARHGALLAESWQLAVESQNLLAEGDRYGAIEKALEALPGKDLFGRPVADEAVQALEDALQVEVTRTTLWRPSYVLDLDDDIVDYVVSPESDWLAVMDASINVSVFKTDTGKLVGTFSPRSFADGGGNSEADGMPSAYKMTAAGDYLVISESVGSGICVGYNAVSGDVTWTHTGLTIRALAPSFGGKALIAVDTPRDSTNTLAINTANGEYLAGSSLDFSMPDIDAMSLPIAVDNERRMVYLGAGDRVVALDLTNSKAIASESIGDVTIESIVAAADGVVVAARSSVDEDPLSPDYGSIECKFAAFDASMQALWSLDDRWTLEASEGGISPRVTGGSPRPTGPLPTTPMLCCAHSA